MNIATQGGAIILKDGKLAESCDCCGGWYCYDDAASGGSGACCRGNGVSVVVSLSGYLECSLSGARITMPEQSQTAVQDSPSGVPQQDVWTHQITQVVLGSREGRSVRLRLTELESTMEFTVLDDGILLPSSSLLTCGDFVGNPRYLPLKRQPPESYLCSEANSLRRWDWIIGKSYSTSTAVVEFGIPVGRFTTFCKLDILGVVYS